MIKPRNAGSFREKLTANLGSTCKEANIFQLVLFSSVSVGRACVIVVILFQGWSQALIKIGRINMRGIRLPTIKIQI